jgi:hypothetical protein
MLPEKLWCKKGVSSLNITVDLDSARCFGGVFSRRLLRWSGSMLDTVVMNWLIPLYRGRGYMYTMGRKELCNLNYAADIKGGLRFKAGALLTTLFLFFTTTTLVSFTLRETQVRPNTACPDLKVYFL